MGLYPSVRLVAGWKIDETEEPFLVEVDGTEMSIDAWNAEFNDTELQMFGSNTTRILGIPIAGEFDPHDDIFETLNESRVSDALDKASREFVESSRLGPRLLDHERVSALGIQFAYYQS